MLSIAVVQEDQHVLNKPPGNPITSITAVMEAVMFRLFGETKFTIFYICIFYQFASYAVF